jgi:tRNA(Ile)-lysidine synthase
MNLEQFAAYVNEACFLAGGGPVVVGVSGGPDSLCLLDALAHLRFPLIAAHFDHGLRPESGADAEFVKGFALRLGIPFITQRQDIASAARDQRLSIEEAARLARYQFLFQTARQNDAQAVAVGHTADDQVETFLMHMIRGAGLPGLIGMAPRILPNSWDSKIALVRPLLSFWREETQAYCAGRGLEPVLDSSNEDITFLRNRVRRELIPMLETYNPLVRQSLWRTAGLLSADAAVINQVVNEAWPACLDDLDEDEVRLRLDTIRSLSTGVLRGVLRKAISQLLPGLQDVDFAAIQRAEQYIRRPGGQVDLVRGLNVFSEGNILLISRKSHLPRTWPQLDITEERDLNIPGRVVFSSGWQIEGEWVERRDLFDWLRLHPPSAWEAWLDAGTKPANPRICRPRPGDRFQPLGMGGRSMKLSDFWINRKHPRRARAGWPLVVCAGEIAWVPGFQPAEPFAIRSETERALHLRLSWVPG